MTVTTGMKSWGWNRHRFLLPGAGFTVEARHMSFSHRCYFFFWIGRWALSSPWKGGLAAALSWDVGTARGAHLLKVIALLVHIIPLCPLQRGKTRSWWIGREGLVRVGCCRLVLFLSPFFRAPWTHFPGDSEVSEGIGEGESTSRQNPICAYRHFSLFLFQPTLFQSWYNSSIHISLRAGQNISSRAPEPEPELSVSAEPTLSTCERHGQEGEGESSPQQSPASLLGPVAMLI